MTQPYKNGQDWKPITYVCMIIITLDDNNVIKCSTCIWGHAKITTAT